MDGRFTNIIQIRCETPLGLLGFGLTNTERLKRFRSDDDMDVDPFTADDITEDLNDLADLLVDLESRVAADDQKTTNLTEFPWVKLVWRGSLLPGLFGSEYRKTNSRTRPHASRR